MKTDNASCYQSTPLISFFSQNQSHFPITILLPSSSSTSVKHRLKKIFVASKTGSHEMHVASFDMRGIIFFLPQT